MSSLEFGQLKPDRNEKVSLHHVISICVQRTERETTSAD